MHPIVEVIIDGTPVAGAFYQRLISLSVTDKEGVSSDTFQAELNDGPPDFLALPRTGAIADIRMGYRETGVRSVGRFTIDKVSAKCLPYGISISGKSADLRKGKLKENKERHWDDKTLAQILKEIAGESGLAAQVDGSIGNHKYTWLAQQDESDIHFVERLARRHNALFSIKAGWLIFAARGSGLAAGGAFMGTVVVTPGMIVQGSCTFEANDRTRYSKVVAYYQDRDKAERIEVEAEGDGDSDSIFRLPEPYADAGEADKAAQAKAKQLKRGEGATSVSVLGDTRIVAGAALLYSGVRPGLDGVPYVIDTVTYDHSKGAGFVTKISGKLYDGKSGGGKSNASSGSSGAGDTGPSAPQAPDVVAPNSAAGTPATPSAWGGFTRNTGLADAS